MKYFLLFSMNFCLSVSFAQTIDSVAIMNVDSLIQVSRALTGQRQLDKALEVNIVAEKIALELLGRETAAYGSCCINHGRILYFQGNLPEAEKWYAISKEIRERVLGKEHPDYAASLNGLAIIHHRTRKYDLAESLYLESKDIKEKVLGKLHPEYAVSLNNLANLYKDMGRYDNVESYYQESLTIIEEVLGKGHPDYVGGLMNLSNLYYSLGQYERAEPLLQEIMTIRELIPGKDHPDYATSLNLLANLYSKMGQYERAEILYITSTSIREKVWGKEHPEYAESLINLGILYVKMGQFDKAEPLYQESRIILERTLGPDHPNVASSLNGLAILYVQMGQHTLAETLYIKSRSIREKVWGKEHPEYAESLNNLSNLYQDIGQYDKAEPLLLESMAIREKSLGREHPEYAESLHNLANLYKDMGRYDKAELLILESRAIKERLLGKEHPSYATSENNLAVLYYHMGLYEKSEALFLASKAIRENMLGKEHPDFAGSLENLGTFYQELGQYDKAVPYFLALSAVNQKLMARAMLYQSETELNAYIQKFTNNLNLVLSLARLSGRKELSPICYDNSLFYKGFLLQAGTQVKRLARSDPQTSELFNQLIGYHRRLGDLYAQPLPKQDNNRVMELETLTNALEKDLLRSVAGFREAMQHVTWQDVQAAIPDTAIAVEFVHYQERDHKQADKIRYAVLLLGSGSQEPLFIPLFEEQEMLQLIRTDQERKADYVNELYSWSERGMIQLGGEKKSLYDLIWAKIEAAGLEGIKTVYYSPSGVLHRLNLGAIAVDDETILSDRYQLIALNSTRQLVIPSPIITQANDAFLVGGVNFEADTLHVTPDEDTYLASRSIADTWTASGTRGGTWSYLKWTEKEVERIGFSLSTSGFDVTKLSDKKASEEEIKSIGSQGPSPRVLHLATHGFFFPDPEITNERPGFGESEPVFKSSDNPMIRSGLILAGGNYAWQHGRAVSPDKEDGILTAYEISQMNLANTELVVLSACETGLGDIQGNEGVYGLQRAFKIAGAKYLIMSLWQVPDRETMEFMTTFYNNWLEGKLTIPDAFRKTQREMRDRFYNPYSWAGFVLVE